MLLQLLACLVYLHSFNGCRLEALPASAIAAKLGIALCTFDFSGCGVSGGELVTLGYR
jgi:hypothetical protein